MIDKDLAKLCERTATIEAIQFEQRDDIKEIKDMMKEHQKEHRDTNRKVLFSVLAAAGSFIFSILKDTFKTG